MSSIRGFAKNFNYFDLTNFDEGEAYSQIDLIDTTALSSESTHPGLRPDNLINFYALLYDNAGDARQLRLCIKMGYQLNFHLTHC